MQFYRRSVYRRMLLLWGVVVFLFVNPSVCESENTKDVKVGILAKRGQEHTLAKWGPTADYLTKNIEGYSFEIVPLSFEDVYSAAESKQVEFILANSSFYVGLEMLHGMNRIVTLRNLVLEKGCTVFGGVIFCKADREDIAALDDLKDKSFLAVHEISFGGWQMAWRELKDKGVDPYKDFAEMKFAGTHDAVVYAVLEGKADAGTVRTDTLERMHEEGRIDLNDFCILNQYGDHSDHSDFPYVHSTRLYPEWPLAKAKHTSDELAEDVASALLSMPPDSKAAKAARCAGWTIPHNYQAVHDCLKELSVGPYKDYGKVTLTQVFTEYWLFIVFTISGIILLCIFTLYTLRLSHRLRKAQIELKKHRDNLERLVDERTEELRLERDKLSTIFENMEDGIYIVNQNYDLEYSNSSFKTEFGPTEGQKCYSSIHNINEVCPWCKMPEVLEGKTAHWDFVSPQTGKTYDIIETLLKNIDGAVSKLAIIRDITERKRAENEILASEQQLRAANQQLRAADQQREKLVKTLEFKNKELQDVVYTASHDLRSPLVNIEGFSGELTAACDLLLQLFAEQAEEVDKKEQVEQLLEQDIPQSLGFITGSTKKCPVCWMDCFRYRGLEPLKLVVNQLMSIR